MADRHHLGTVLRHLRRLSPEGHAPEVPDHELLCRFRRQGDETAFEAVLARHGPLVWGVCRRALPDRRDAEDVFQATFLTLARKAVSVRDPGALGPWLHGVAARLASKVRAQADRRRTRESQAVSPRAEPADPLAEVTAREACAALDEELAGLPERLRVPLLLCYLEGLARDEAARRLGWSLGTLKRRLEQGRALLRVRLARRGLALSGGLLALALGEGTAGAVPAGLRVPLAEAAAALVAGKPLPATLSAATVALAAEALRATPSTRMTALAAVLALVAACAGFAFWPQPAPDDPAPPPAKSAPGQEEKAAQADLHDDPLPPDALARLGTVRFRSDSFVTTVAVSPDGKTLASAGYSSSVRLWDLASGRPLRDLRGHERFISGLAFAPDGRSLATASADRTVRVWDVAGGAERLRLTGHEREVLSVAFAPDGSHLASGGRDGTVRLWVARTGQEVWKDHGTRAAVNAVAFAPDGKAVVSGGADGAVILRETGTGKEQRRFEGHRSSVAAVAFTTDGKALVTGSRHEATNIFSSVIPPEPARFADKDGALRVWDAATAKALLTLPGPKDGVTSIAPAPNGQSLVVTGGDNTVRLYDAATGKERWQAGGQLPWVRHAAFADGGKALVTCGDAALLFRDAATGAEARRSPAHIRCVSAVAFSPDGKTTATAGWDHTIRLWDAAGRERLALEGHQGGVMALAFGPDGTTLASAGEDRTVRLWDVAADKELRRFEGHEDFAEGLAFSADGKALVSVGADQTIRVWDVAGGKQLLRHAAKGQTRLSSMAAAPNGQRVAVGCFEGMPADQFVVRVFETEAGQEVLKLTAEKFDVPALAFSADGALLAGGGRDGSVRVWDSATGEVVRTVKHGGEVLALAFSPDGRVLASGGAGGAVRVWEFATGGERLGFTGLSNCHSLAFAPGGVRLVSGHFDSAALVWDVAGGVRPRPLTAETLETLWKDLGSDDAARAYRAVRELAAAPTEAVPFLRDRLPAVSEKNLVAVDALAADLNADDFEVRQRATAGLEALGHAAAAKVRKLLEGKPAAEAGRRAEGILAKLAARPLDAEAVRGLRAVEALEYCGTAEARQALRMLGERAICPRTGTQAGDALRRLGGE